MARQLVTRSMADLRPGAATRPSIIAIHKVLDHVVGLSTPITPHAVVTVRVQPALPSFFVPYPLSPRAICAGMGRSGPSRGGSRESPRGSQSGGYGSGYPGMMPYPGAYPTQPPPPPMAPYGYYGRPEENTGYSRFPGQSSGGYDRRHDGSRPSRHDGGGGYGHASALAGATMPLRVEDLVGKVMAMSKDQNGCRLLQQKLDDGDARIHELVFQECLPHLPELMMDPFGNYLFQKMIEHCTPASRLVVLRTVATDDAGSPPVSSFSSPVTETRSLTQTPVVGTSNNTSPLPIGPQPMSGESLCKPCERQVCVVMRRCMCGFRGVECVSVVTGAFRHCAQEDRSTVESCRARSVEPSRDTQCAEVS